ncbi:MAG: ubiquitin-like small modifier protein 1 [Candidatus Bathyarchaeia archaeon]
MPEVIVKLYTSLREIAGEKETKVNAETIKEVLKILSEKYGNEFKNHLLDENGNLKPFFHIMVNGRKMGLLDGVETRLKDGDVLDIFPPVGGGYYEH